MKTAIRLANDRTMLARLHEKLQKALPHSRLYDAGRMARQFGTIYRLVMDRHTKGLPPAHFDVEL